MAILAESIVEEWLNRQRFFTIRGAKKGQNEADILAVRQEPASVMTAWHVEVQVSLAPIGHITPWKGKSPATARTQEVMAECAQKWVEKKFLSENMRILRETLWGELEWSFHFVHGVARHPGELRLIEDRGIKLHPFFEVLESLCADGRGLLKGSGGDMAEIIRYYQQRKHETYSREAQPQVIEPSAPEEEEVDI